MLTELDVSCFYQNLKVEAPETDKINPALAADV